MQGAHIKQCKVTRRLLDRCQMRVSSCRAAAAVAQWWALLVALWRVVHGDAISFRWPCQLVVILVSYWWPAMVTLTLKGATSQVAGSLAVLDQTVIVLDRTVITIYSVLSFPSAWGWVIPSLVTSLRDTPAHRPSQLSPVSVVTDNYVCKTLLRAGFFPGARSCAFNFLLKLSVLNPLVLSLAGRQRLIFSHSHVCSTFNR